MGSHRQSKSLERWVREIVTEVTHPLEVGMAEMQGKLSNGLESRVRQIERMQWWQIGIMVAMIGALIGGMWMMLQRGSLTARENQQLLLQHIEQGQKP
jgi:hypothetical protein